MIAINTDVTRNIKITNELGLHARAAAKIAALAQLAISTVWISKNNEKVDAASVIDILTLACAKGSWVELTIENPADIEILNEIEALVNKGFGEQKV